MVEITRQCKDCKIHKTASEYYSVCKDGVTPRGSICKLCQKARNVVRHGNLTPEQRRRKSKVQHERHSHKTKVKSREYYRTRHGRIKSMLKTADRRSSKFEDECNITYEYIDELFNKCNDECMVSGLSFNYLPVDGMKCNPYAPSLDRIDSTKGYVVGNVRLVCWQINLMKGEITDDELKKFCQAILDRG